MKVGFDGEIKHEFHGAKVSSNGGLLAYRDHHEREARRRCTFLRWPLRSLLVKLIKVGAKVVRHSRYITFQMAEVAIDKRLFTEILTRIERFR